ncbi:hypothetical protein H8E88_17250 [candidate division KSB1 bacterium]|nr:hypothetical protein [candidate division KSB1 bacterium]
MFKKLKRPLFNLTFLFLCILLFYSISPAQDLSPRNKIGITTQAILPLGNLGDWYGLTPNFGATNLFLLSSKLNIEIEYGYARYLNGSIEEKTFFWPVDKTNYLSPQAEAYMNFHRFLVSFYFIKKEKLIFGKTISPFLSVGSGFYAFNNKVSGLIYPGQGVKPLDQTLLLTSVSDNQVSIGANFGAGFDLKLVNKLSLNFFLRYHMILGTIRSFEDWGLKEVLPLQLLDFGLGVHYAL